MDAASSRDVRVATAADGSLTYLVTLGPEALPPVRAGDLDAVWHAARGAAVHAHWGTVRRFRFHRADGDTTDLALADADACCWADAVDATVGMRSRYGLSLCLRLLALVDLLAHARWADGLFTLKRDGAELAPVLLQAAATSGLTAEARFDAERMWLTLAGEATACRRLPGNASSGFKTISDSPGARA